MIFSLQDWLALGECWISPNKSQKWKKEKETELMAPCKNKVCNLNLMSINELPLPTNVWIIQQEFHYEIACIKSSFSYLLGPLGYQQIAPLITQTWAGKLRQITIWKNLLSRSFLIKIRRKKTFYLSLVLILQTWFKAVVTSSVRARLYITFRWSV